MAESSKLKLLYILEIMQKTDEYHPLNSTEIAKKLALRGITAERKSIGRDLDFLDEAGYSIMRCEDHNKGYYMTGQLFEDHELKLLADAVVTAPFFTIKDSEVLLNKIKALATVEGEQLIGATVYMDESIKSDDKCNKIKIDTIIRAIKAHKKISFQYYDYTVDHNKRSFRRGGYRYKVSPYYLALNNNEYYLICNTDTNDHLGHYLLERIANIEGLDEPFRNPSEIIEHGNKFNLPVYLRQSVNMWTGDIVNVKLRCRNSIRDMIRMRYGKDLWLHDDGEDHFIISVNVCDNQGFYQWMAQSGKNVKVISPDNVRNSYLAYVRNILKMYEPR